VNEGDRLDVGDRTLTAVRPPVFDNPTTRGLFDDRTGVYWSVDSFALPVQQPLQDVADIPDGEFEEGELLGGRVVAAWHPCLDDAKFGAYVSEVQSMPIEVIASCHAPAIRGDRIATAFDLLRRLPTMEPWSPFTQADLEGWLAMMGGGPPPA
jgi:flavorubredoxin